MKKERIFEKIEGGMLNNQIIAKKLLTRCKSDSNIDKNSFIVTKIKNRNCLI